MVARNVKVEGTCCAAGTFTVEICFQFTGDPSYFSSILFTHVNFFSIYTRNKREIPVIQLVFAI